MSEMKRITVTVTKEMADAVEAALAGGDYASTSEIVREALRHWRRVRREQEREFEELKTKIEEGLAAAEAGDVYEFDPDDLKREGRRRRSERERSG